MEHWSEATASASKAICTLHWVTDFVKKMELDQVNGARLLPPPPEHLNTNASCYRFHHKDGVGSGGWSETTASAS